MKALSESHERLLEKLLQYAGSSGLLEEALVRARMKKRDQTTIEDVIRCIDELREKVPEHEKHPEPA